MLPSVLQTFHFEHQGSYEKYEGDFTVKCKLTFKERNDFNIIKARLLGGLSTEDNFSDLGFYPHVLATLKTRIVESPEWFKESGCGENLLDHSVAFALHNKLYQCERDWEEKMKPAPKESTGDAN